LKYCIGSIGFDGAENRTLRKVDQNCLESFKVWCCGRVEKITWTDRMKDEVLKWVQEEKTSHTQQKERRLTGLVTSCLGTAC